MAWGLWQMKASTNAKAIYQFDLHNPPYPILCWTNNKSYKLFDEIMNFATWMCGIIKMRQSIPEIDRQFNSFNVILEIFQSIFYYPGIFLHLTSAVYSTLWICWNWIMLKCRDFTQFAICRFWRVGNISEIVCIFVI